MEQKMTIPSRMLSVRQMAVAGMLAGVSAILGLTGYGFIPLPFMKATVMHIPVIIGALVEGPMVGLMVGLLFGLFSIFQSIIAPNVLSFMFLNPLVSVLPRMLIGLTAYAASRLPVGGEVQRFGLAAVVGSLTNTVGVLGMIYVIYAADFAAARGISPEATLAAVWGIAVMNGLPEAAISAIITVPVVMMVRKVRQAR